MPEEVKAEESLDHKVDVTVDVVQAKPAPKSFWAKVWGFIKRYLLGPLPALILIALAIIAVVLGAKNIQIGGLLGKLLGRKEGKKALDVANTVPKDRVRDDGTVIKVGEPDEKGMTQAKVVAIEKTGLFSDPDTVKIKEPGEKKAKVIDLPTGVKAKDVDKVVVVKPEVYAVTIRDSSDVNTQDIDDLLAKYGDL